MTATSEELEETFSYFFQRGAAAERYISNGKLFDQALIVLENQLRHQTEAGPSFLPSFLLLPTGHLQTHIGGNAALMAEKLASSYVKAKILLVGPIGWRYAASWSEATEAEGLSGPRLKALLHPNIITQNSTKISKDELHIAMEYKQGEIWG